MAHKDCGCDDDYFDRKRARERNKSGGTVDPKEQLYKATIMKHYRSMEHRRVIHAADIESKQVNRSCGDQVRLFIKLNQQGKIEDSSYQGEGCSVCISSTSILCHAINGLTLAEAAYLGANVLAMLKSEDASEAIKMYNEFAAIAGIIDNDTKPTGHPFEDILALWSVRQFGSRVPCALLSWSILPTLIESIAEDAPKRV